LEILVVIGILSVLLGLLYGTLERTRKFSRYTITYNELKQIEAAFEQYYSYYSTWPTNGVIPLEYSTDEAGMDYGFIITKDIAYALQGTLTGAFAGNNPNPNPDRIPFIEFQSSRPPNRDGAPVNPFRTTQTDTGTEDPRVYKVLFDTSGNRQITVPPDPLAPDSTVTTIVANVAVWTVIPGFRKAEGTGNSPPEFPKEMRLGSWDKFDLQR